MKGGYLTIGHWRGSPVRLHWTLPVGALLFGQGRIAPGLWLGYFLVLLLHALGHARLVRRYRCKVVAIEFHAVGGECRWAGTPTPIQRARIAAGGVSAQLVLLVATLIAMSLLGSAGTPFVDDLAGAFTVVNGWIIVFNLIPVRPLDGVEILKLPGLLRAQSRSRVAREDRAAKSPRREAERELDRLDAADREGASRDTAAAVEAKLSDLARGRKDDKPN